MVDLYIHTFYDDMKYWLVNEDGEIHKFEITTRQISAIFYDEIEALLKKLNSSYKDIKKIVFINGPGSFTSLRFFLTFAKSLKVSFPEIQVIPLNLLEMMAFTKDGISDVIMGGSREFLKFFHYGRYEKVVLAPEFRVVEDVKLVSYEDASKMDKPLFIGVKPDFEVEEYIIKLEDMINFSNYKLASGDVENIISLTPYYYKQFVTKKV